MPLVLRLNDLLGGTMPHLSGVEAINGSKQICTKLNSWLNQVVNCEPGHGKQCLWRWCREELLQQFATGLLLKKAPVDESGSMNEQVSRSRQSGQRVGADCSPDIGRLIGERRIVGITDAIENLKIKALAKHCTHTVRQVEAVSLEIVHANELSLRRRCRAVVDERC